MLVMTYYKTCSMILENFERGRPFTPLFSSYAAELQVSPSAAISGLANALETPVLFPLS